MPPEPTRKTQLTQPKGIDPKTGKPYEPVEIPIPHRDDFERLIRRATKEGRPESGSESTGKSDD